MASEPDRIASTELVWVDPDGTRRPGRIAIARPHRRETGEWGCQVEVGVFENRTRTIFGASSWQALQLALQLIGYDVHRFVEGGGSMLWPFDPDDDEDGDQPYPPELLLGPLFRAPKGT